MGPRARIAVVVALLAVTALLLVLGVDGRSTDGLGPEDAERLWPGISEVELERPPRAD